MLEIVIEWSNQETRVGAPELNRQNRRREIGQPLRVAIPLFFCIFLLTLLNTYLNILGVSRQRHYALGYSSG